MLCEKHSLSCKASHPEIRRALPFRLSFWLFLQKTDEVKYEYPRERIHNPFDQPIIGLVLLVGDVAGSVSSGFF